MPIDKCPFVRTNDILRPYLGVNIINPHTGKSLYTYGLVDTGADECAIPARYARLLGHKLRAGDETEVGTGKGKNIAYAHITAFEIYHPVSGKHLYDIKKAPIDFLPKLEIVLLGVKSFLGKFVLKIDYPKKTFSIKHP